MQIFNKFIECHFIEKNNHIINWKNLILYDRDDYYDENILNILKNKKIIFQCINIRIPIDYLVKLLFYGIIWTKLKTVLIVSSVSKLLTENELIKTLKIRYTKINIVLFIAENNWKRYSKKYVSKVIKKYQQININDIILYDLELLKHLKYCGNSKKLAKFYKSY